MKKIVLVGLSVAFSLISINTAFSKTPPQQVKPTTVIKTEVETPLCYLQTPDGKTWDLDSLCVQAPKEANSKSKVVVVNPYNNAAITKFDDDLYGKDN